MNKEEIKQKIHQQSQKYVSIDGSSQYAILFMQGAKFASELLMKEYEDLKSLRSSDLWKIGQGIIERDVKIEELKKDQARFNWMIENKAIVHHKGSNVFLFYGAGVYQEDDFKTPREAIDAAMKEGIKNG